MKRSELKRLIREVIEEISADMDLDPYEADSDFETVVDIHAPESNNIIENVPVHVYTYLLKAGLHRVVLAKQDVLDGSEVVFKRGEDVFDYVTERTYDKIY
jgi:hypothetical protein